MSDIRKILNTLTEMTSGSVASVSMPLTTQRRQDHVDENDAKSNPPEVLEYGNWENSSLTTSKKLKQTRGKAKKLVKKIYGEDTTTESMDGVAPSTKMFTSEGKTKNPVARAAQRVAKGSGKHKNPAKVLPRKAKHKKMYEEEITEQDLIISPVIRRVKDRDLISRDHSRVDHEVEMARGDLHQSQQNAAKILKMIQNTSEQEGLEGWVQEKIIKASDYLNTVREYLENKGQQGVAEGTGSGRVYFKVIDNTGTGMPPGFHPVSKIEAIEDGYYIELDQPGLGMNYTKHNYKNFALRKDSPKGMPITGKQAYNIVNKQGVAEGLEDKKAQQRKTERDKQRTAPAQKARNTAQRKGLTQDKDGTYYAKEGVAEGFTKQARAKKEAESVKAVIARLEQELKDTNPHIDKDDIRRRLETERRRLELYRDVLDDKDVTEGFSDVVKGIKRSIKGKEHPNVVSSKHAGRAIGHYNQGDIAAGDKETERYVKTRDMHLKAKGVAEDSDQELVRRQGSYWDQVAKEKRKEERAARRAKKAEYEETPAGKAEKYWSQKGVAEDLDANQRRVGQLGPTEKIGKRGTQGRLVGGN